MEFYSKGGHASVYRISDELKRHSPQSDLVRMENRISQSPGEAIRTFYRHKITEILLPDHIIHVTAAFHEFSERNGEEQITNYLLSQQAAIPPEHAIYSTHMRKTFGGIHPCTCHECATHERRYHRKQQRVKAAEIAIHSGYEWGIYLPYDDPTDYCTDELGSIVYFETEGIDPEAIRERLILNIDNIERPLIDRVFNYLDRYELSVRNGQDYAIDHHTAFHE